MNGILRRKMLCLNRFPTAGSGCAERMEIDIPKLRGDKIRVTVLKNHCRVTAALISPS